MIVLVTGMRDPAKRLLLEIIDFLYGRISVKFALDSGNGLIIFQIPKT